MTKNLVSSPILAHLAQIWAAIFFFKNLASPVTKCHGHLSLSTISEKINDPILRKLSDGRTDWNERSNNCFQVTLARLPSGGF